MKPSKFTTGKMLALLLAAAALASCVAHGRQLDRKMYVNHTPYSADFYRKLLSDRVFVYEGRRSYRNVVSGLVFGADGTVFECRAHRDPGNKKLSWYGWDTICWSRKWAGNGGELVWQRDPQRRRQVTLFYEPDTGGLSVENRRQLAWIVTNPGQIQDTWPHALAEACPDQDIPAHIRINEKQTSLRMDELRRQDPDAPIRNFPGAHLTAPGRTGLGRSGGRPTTTKAEVEAFLKAQHGNVLINGKKIGVTYVRSGDREEFWRIGEEYHMAEDFWDIVRVTDEVGEWIEIHDGPRVRRRYPMGYPFPYPNRWLVVRDIGSAAQ